MLEARSRLTGLLLRIIERKQEIMSSTILYYFQIGVGVLLIIGAVILFISGIRSLLSFSQRIHELQASEQYTTWYTYPPILNALGLLFFSLGVMLVASTLFIEPTNREALIIRLIIGCIGLLLVGIATFFIFRARAISSFIRR